MALSGSQKAYLYARSGIARSGATRSHYVAALATIEWIVRDTAGNIVSTTDLSGEILLHSLQIGQSLNDEADTCSFTLRPQEPPALVPAVGDEIRIVWAPGGPPLFHGYVVVTQADWRLGNLQPPWIAVQCQDPMWRFDARIVTYRFPAQSVSASIAELVKYFCNLEPNVAHPLDFALTYVQAGMPSIPAFDVVNQRPSTVMRNLTASVAGGFYIDGLTVHAWANSVSEPNQQNPTPLTVGLRTLHSFRKTEDATQVRRRVLVEGQRTSTVIAIPGATRAEALALGIPVEDVNVYPPNARFLARLGTQWVYVENAVSNTNSGNPPQGNVATAFHVVGSTTLAVKNLTFPPAPQGWIRVGSQYSRYTSFTGSAGVYTLQGLPVAPMPYGVFTVPLAVDETVEFMNGFMKIEPHGLGWNANPPAVTPGDDALRSHPSQTPLVILVMVQTGDPLADRWPPLEGFVQDGRYVHSGAEARGLADLATFKDPRVHVEWQTDDVWASPGRSQVIALASEHVNPPVNMTVTILHVSLSFPLRTLPPRRQCAGGLVKPSTFLDVVVTSTS